MCRLMNVPKWLIPVISVIAALALGVSMAFVGANFASKTTIDVAAKTEVDPVIAPAASGLSGAEVKALLASTTPVVSPEIGNERVTLPGVLPAKSAVEREVERLAGGGQLGAASSPSPSPAPGVVPYVPTPAPANDDPCATTDGSTPEGCPGGLHSRIFADTMPPRLNFVATPFDPHCGTSPVSVGDGSPLVNIPILITTTTPATIDVSYFSARQSLRQLPSRPSDPTTSALWRAAIGADTPVANLPSITTCVTLPNLERGVVYDYEVGVYSPTDEGADRHGMFNTTGAPVLQPLTAETVGSDGLVVIGDYRTSEQLGIRVFTGAAASTTTCANASVTLHELSPVDNRSFPTSAFDATALNEPADITNREALGYVLRAGSTVLLCGRWFNSGTAPSWARTTPLRSSTVVVQAPDEILPSVHVEGTGIYDNPGAATVTVSIATTEGEPCGSSVIYRGQFSQASRDGVLDCSLAGAGTVNARTDFLDNIGFRGDLRITVTVLYSDGHSGTHSQVLPTSEHRPTSCDDSDIHDLCGNFDDLYWVGVPYYYLANGHSPADGLLSVDVSWVKVGSTGLDEWVIEPQNVQVAPPVGDPALAAPLLNTDNRVTAVTASGPQRVSASFDLQSNTPADYTMSLVGISGPGCAATAAPLTVHGHVTSHATVVIPGLCFGALYWASVTLTNAHGTSVWGHANPGAGWLGNLLHTPYKSETLFVQETVNAGVGHIVRYVDFTIGGQEIDPYHLPASCYSSGNLSADRHSFRLPTSTTLHIHYELRAGLRTSSGGCQLIAGTSTNPTTVDADFPINLTTLAANPAGMTITQGPVTVLIREFVEP
jgi:hypothetical protein